MPDEHARLSPSASGRWLSCPASVRLIERLEPSTFNESVYAAEGTRAHALAELVASFRFGIIDRETYDRRYWEWTRTPPAMDDDDIWTMRQHVEGYVQFLENRLTLYPMSMVLLEQRLPTGIPSCWGTSDAVIVSPEHIEIVDLKYGQGNWVDAENNSQLRLYALGALDTFGDLLGETKIVRMSIYQPRMNNVQTEEITPEELRAWREEIRPIAEEALSDDAHFGPSESACRFCPAAGICRARVEKLAAEDFSEDPDVISDEELGELLGRIPEIRQWVDAIEKAALHRLYSEGRSIPGWKVVLSGQRRYITDEEKAIKRLKALGLGERQITNVKLKSLGELDRAIRALNADQAGQATLETTLGNLLQKSAGRPSVVPESDRRRAIDPNTEAAKDFS